MRGKWSGNFGAKRVMLIDHLGCPLPPGWTPPACPRDSTSALGRDAERCHSVAPSPMAPRARSGHSVAVARDLLFSDTTRSCRTGSVAGVRDEIE